MRLSFPRRTRGVAARPVPGGVASGCNKRAGVVSIKWCITAVALQTAEKNQVDTIVPQTSTSKVLESTAHRVDRLRYASVHPNSSVRSLHALCSLHYSTATQVEVSTSACLVSLKSMLLPRHAYGLRLRLKVDWRNNASGGRRAEMAYHGNQKRIPTNTQEDHQGRRESD